MPCQVIYFEHERIVETYYRGAPTMEELQKVAQETLIMANEMNTRRLLGNCAELRSGGSELDIYALIEFFESMPIDR